MEGRNGANGGENTGKTFTQEEVNQIVSSRLKEEREKMRAEMKANSEAYNAQLQKIMTKDQYASYTKKQAEREQRMKDGRRQKK